MFKLLKLMETLMYCWLLNLCLVSETFASFGHEYKLSKRYTELVQTNFQSYMVVTIIKKKSIFFDFYEVDL